jgi:hypothetical protein
MLFRISLLILAAGFLSACGNDSGRPEFFLPIPQPVTTTGVFLDAPVENVDFATATQNGTTNAQGEF